MRDKGITLVSLSRERERERERGGGEGEREGLVHYQNMFTLVAYFGRHELTLSILMFPTPNLVVFKMADMTFSPSLFYFYLFFNIYF